MSPLLPALLLLLGIQILTTHAAQNIKQGKWSQELGRWMLLPEASKYPAIYENPDDLSWEDAVTLCEENHATPFLPGQASEWSWLVQKAKSLNGASMWLPMSDNITEGVLYTWNDLDASNLPIKWLREESLIHNNGARNCVLLSAEWGYRAIMAPCNHQYAAMICVAQEERCCMAGPPETEAYIAKQGTKEVAVFMEEGKKNVYVSFKAMLSKSITGFKSGFTSEYMTSHEELFSNLESLLETYYMFGQENFSESFAQVFLDIYQSVFAYQQQGDDRYNDCIGKALDESNPFEDDKNTSSSMIKTMIVMRTLTKGFGIGEQAMNGILKASPPNRACWKEFPKMVQCLRCGLSMKQLPCRGYCEQVTKLCFRHTLPLVPVWYEYIDGMGKLIDSLLFPEKQTNGLLDHLFHKTIRFMYGNLRKAIGQCGDSGIQIAIQSGCIPDIYVDASTESSEESEEEEEEEENKEEEEKKEEEENKEEDENAVEENADEDEESSEEDDNDGLQSILYEIKFKLAHYREFWADLPSEMCRENPWAGEGVCRNQSISQESANSPVPVIDPENPTKMELQIQLIDHFNLKINSALDNQEIIWNSEHTPIYVEPTNDWCTGDNEVIVGEACIVAVSDLQVPREGIMTICNDLDMQLPHLIDMNHISALNKIQGSSQYWTSGKLSLERTTKTFNKWVWPSQHIISPEECPACYDETYGAECLSWSPDLGLKPADCSSNYHVLCQKPNPKMPAYRQDTRGPLKNQYAWLNNRIVTVPDAGSSVTWEEASALCREDGNLKPYVPWSRQEFNAMAKVYTMFNFNSDEAFWLPAAVHEEGGSINWIKEKGSEHRVRISNEHMRDPSNLPRGQVFNLVMPDEVYSGSSATLECQWTDTDSIHAVMWFKDDVNFFTYWEDRNVTELATNVLGITIDPDASNGQQITLVDITSDSGGLYRCEVMLDEPSYSMTYMEGNLLVIDDVLWWNENPPFNWRSDENQCIAYSEGATFYPCAESLLPMICEYSAD